MTFGKRLRTARNAKHLTQKQLADCIGAKHNSVSDWENDKNKPDPDTIEILCGILEITPNYLLGSDTNAFSPLETNIIKKYRTLDDYGKETVSIILDRELHRTEQLSQQENVSQDSAIDFSTLGVKAAHNDNIYDEGELDKINNDMTKLKRPN